MLARLSKGLKEEELTRAHYITMFYLLGFESGHRLRRYARMGFTQPHYIRYVAEQTTHPGLHGNDPFFQGWCLGWKFEPLTVPPQCHEPGCNAAPIEESDFCGAHQD